MEQLRYHSPSLQNIVYDWSCEFGCSLAAHPPLCLLSATDGASFSCPSFSSQQHDSGPRNNSCNCLLYILHYNLHRFVFSLYNKQLDCIMEKKQMNRTKRKKRYL